MISDPVVLKEVTHYPARTKSDFIRLGCTCDRTEIEQSVKEIKIYYEEKALQLDTTL